jgi:hypothetical protein
MVSAVCATLYRTGTGKTWRGKQCARKCLSIQIDINKIPGGLM